MIRILHTADWHLGREFHRRDMTFLHEHFFDWLEEVVETRQIDLLLMAGDIYDRALPPVGAVSLLNERLAQLARLTKVVMITGNHDSVGRMSHGSLMGPSLHLRSGTERLGEPVLIGEPFPLAIYPIPYLDPVTMSGDFGLDDRSHEAILTAAVDRCRNDLASRPGTRAVAVAHAFIIGSGTSDSERDIQVGGSEGVPATVFDGFDYVALGHLHRPQEAADGVRYSGSPVPLSYSEVGIGEPKSVTVIELEADGETSAETIEVPQAVTMARVSDTLENLVTGSRYEGLRDTWLEVTVTDENRPDQPMERLRTRFDHVVSLRVKAALAETESGFDPVLIEKLDPREIVGRFFEYVRGEGHGLDPEEESVIQRAFDEHTSRESRS